MNKLTGEENKQLLLKLLSYFDSFCREHDIKYSIMFGTLLGAIRHKGFIPWDDDIDVILDYENHNKLLNCIDKIDTNKYNFINSDIDNTYHLPFDRIVDKRTGIVDYGNNVSINDGVHIDIFTFCYTSNDINKQRKQFKKYSIYRSFIWIINTNIKETKLPVLKLIRHYLLKLYGRDRVVKLYKKNMNKYNLIKSNYYMPNWTVYSFENEVFPKSVMNEFVDVRFENINVMMSSSYHNILTILYGDYMTLPPIEKRITVHTSNTYWK